TTLSHISRPLPLGSRVRATSPAVTSSSISTPSSLSLSVPSSPISPGPESITPTHASITSPLPPEDDTVFWNTFFADLYDDLIPPAGLFPLFPCFPLFSSLCSCLYHLLPFFFRLSPLCSALSRLFPSFFRVCPFFSGVCPVCPSFFGVCPSFLGVCPVCPSFF